MFVAFAWVMRAPTRRAATRQGSLRERVQAHHDHEMPVLLRVRQLLGVPFYVGLIAWTVAPSSMSWSATHWPAWTRGLGLALGGVAIALNAWSHRTLARHLGDAFDPALRLRPVPRLVTDGPFAFCRHPIYLAFLVVQIATLLITGNWLIGATGLGIIAAVTLLRVPEEERRLTDQFGDAYRHYQARTSLLIPGLW